MVAVNDTPDFHHVPVLVRECLEGLRVQPGGCYLDSTVGGGGHSEAILRAAPDVQLVAIDRDDAALAAARSRLAVWDDRVAFWHGNFAEYVPPAGMRFDGILADLGVSSAQFDRGERGFSFQHPGPLDMRMDRQQERTAADIVNTWSERELADVLFQLGEERYSRRIARAIAAQRPFHRTDTLAAAIFAAVPPAYRHGRIHPATRSFQALRLAVNGELESLTRWLARCPEWLAPAGRLCVISFHSLEDRLVKHALRQDARLEVLTKKPVVPQPAEVEANPRARSAKLRIACRTVASGCP